MDGQVDELIQVPAFILASELGLQFRVHSPLQKSSFSVSSTHTIWGARAWNASAYAAVFLCRRQRMSEHFAQNVL